MIDELKRMVRMYERQTWIGVIATPLMLVVYVWNDVSWWAYVFIVWAVAGTVYNWRRWRKGQRLLNDPLIYLVALSQEFGSKEGPS